MLRTRPVVLGTAARSFVEQAIKDHCTLRSWKLHALNVRSNHVHLVVTCPDRVTPENAMSQFKAWTTRTLRETGHVEPNQKTWTEHGSTRWIDSESSLKKAIDYVLYHQ
jgi:REP element-mobilizing transposase RayT